MKKLLVSIILFIASCTTLPQEELSKQFYAQTKGKIYQGSLRTYAPGPDPSPYMIAFKEGDGVLNAEMVPPSGFTWTWGVLYKVLYFQSSTQVVIQLKEPSWDFPWDTSEEEMKGKDQLHVLEIRDNGNTLLRTEYGKFTTSGAWDGKRYSSDNLQKFGAEFNPVNYPKVITYYADASDFVGTQEPFDPKAP